MKREKVCDCNHRESEHDPGGGHCRGLDSYGCPCSCPSVETFQWDEMFRSDYD